MSSVFPVFFFIVFFGIVGFMIAVFAKALSERAANDRAPVETRSARIVSKRSNVSGTSNGSHTSYFVTFEFEDGSRREMRANGDAFGLLAEGDFGVLRSQGTRFISFARQAEITPSPAVSSEGWHKCEACGATYKGSVCDYCGTPWNMN